MPRLKQKGSKRHEITDGPRRAALYMRMSTEHQQYSVENQTAALEQYASRQQMKIVKVYTDGGRSGLNLSGRGALQELIADVTSGAADYSVILVLDVTRWGRFQDTDEGGHYEYVCRDAGVDVRYVNEQFENDGSPQSNLMKSLKRTMAADYSRELSAKVFAGQCRLIEKGFRQGGAAGYGLRRMLIDERREPKGLLKPGQHKAFQTDRVILVPGPEEEIANVRWIYQSFVEDGLQEAEIAKRLNLQGALTDLGRGWTRGVVHGVLTNEKYIGHNVFNRTSFKLKKERVVNEPEEWVRAKDVFQGIVEPRYFYTAQGIIRERSRRFSDDEMLAKLSLLHERQGWLSGFVIDEAENMPSSSAYQSRFGSLVRAYQLIGYTPERDFEYVEINRHLRQLHASIVEEATQKIITFGGHVRREAPSEMLIINEELRLAVVIARCKQTVGGSSRWKICLESSFMPDLTLVIRMDTDNKTPLDYYLLPSLDVEHPRLRLLEENGLALDAFRFDSLEPFFMLTARVPIREAV